MAKAAGSDSNVLHTLDFRCAGSTRVMSLRVDGEECAGQVATRASEQFGLVGHDLVGFRLTTSVVENPSRSLEAILPNTSTDEVRTLEPREVTFEDGVKVACPVLDRGGLKPGDAGEGPCIIEEAGATTVVPPGYRWRVGDVSMLFLEAVS